MNNISILGCGWLGLPLSEFLISKGYSINGSTTTENKLKLLQEKSISPFFINLPESIFNNSIYDFLNSDILIINIPPRQISYQGKIYEHCDIIEKLSDIISKSKIKYVIYISSVSVYDNTNEMVTEDGPYAENEKATMLLKSESKLCNNSKYETTILRFGGLYGYGRVPFRKVNQELLLNNYRKLNLIHRDYASDVIFEVIKNNIWNEIFNVCEDDQPTQFEFYQKSYTGREIKNYKLDETLLNYKIVSNFKIRNQLGFSFPDKITQS